MPQKFVGIFEEDMFKQSLALITILALTFGVGSSTMAQPTEDEGGEEIGVTLASNPVFWAALEAFQSQQDVSCSLTTGEISAATEDQLATLTAMWICGSNTPGESDNWSVSAAGSFWNGNFTLTSISFGAAE